VTRDEVLAEILRRAHREHGTSVRALVAILDREVAEIHRSADTLADSDEGYAEGMRNAADLVEEAVFEVFNLWPDDVDGLEPQQSQDPAALPRPASR
jgi:hypothetical protein